VYATLPNFMTIGQTGAEIWRFFDFVQNGGHQPSRICYMHVWTIHEEYFVAFLTTQRCSSFDNMHVLVCYALGLKMPIHAPKIAKGTSLRENTSSDVYIVKIRPRMRAKR